MQRKTIIKIMIILVIVSLIIITSTNTFAGVTPSDIKGDELSLDLGFINNVTNLIRTIGAFIAVGALMVIGIQYVTGSIEEKANYKKSMMPYVIGCFVLFGASLIVPKITEIFTKMGEDTENIGNSILGLIQMIGTIVSVGALMILGIKYMMGSTEQRASYKKSMLPYIIGAVLIFGAVNITSAIYNFTTSSVTIYTSEDGTKDAQSYINSLSGLSNEKQKENIEKQITSIRTTRDKYEENSDEYKYYESYRQKLYEWLEGY